MPLIDFPAVRQLIRPADVLCLLDVPITICRDRQARCPCPIHNSKSRTSRILSIDLDCGRFQCFQCGAHGNHLELFAQATKQELYTAVLSLGELLNLALPQKPKPRARTLRITADRHGVRSEIIE